MAKERMSDRLLLLDACMMKEVSHVYQVCGRILLFWNGWSGNALQNRVGDDGPPRAAKWFLTPFLAFFPLNQNQEVIMRLAHF
jgi:hypothetical protein